VIVRPEEPGDRDAAIEVERAAFGRPLEADIAVAVREEPGSFAFVAEDAGEIVGHVQMSTAWVGEHEVLALGPIGVMPAWQRRGIGTALIDAALTEARGREAVAVILLGDPAYYGSRGFGPASAYGLSSPYAGVTEDDFEIDEADFQVAMLDDARVAAMSGEVRWHAAFG
jgi:putative acetyltransferase